MRNANANVARGARAQRGFTVLEVLVTLFLVMMWLLGTAGVQTSALKLNSSAQFRTKAVFFATDIAERMQANPAAAVGGLYTYSSSDGSVSMPVNCTVSACTSENLAAFDLAEWSARVSAALPNGTVSVTTPAGVANPITYSIVIGWTDRQDDRASASGSTESFSYTAARTVFLEPT